MNGLLFAREKKITEHISIHIPTVGEVYDNQDAYYDIVYTIIATPYDMMVQLDDAGIDFTTLTDFELFCILFQRLQSVDTSLVFGDLNLAGFQLTTNEQNGDPILKDPHSGATIDRSVHDQIAQFLRSLLHIEKNTKRPANDEAKRYMIERARRKKKKKSKQPQSSQLEKYIVALVTVQGFPYTYKSIRDITIYQFYSSLHQIIHKIKYDHTMSGYYAGTVKYEDLSPDDKTWIMDT